MIENKILECVFMNHYDDNSCSVSQLADTKSLSHSNSMECTGLSLLFVAMEAYILSSVEDLGLFCGTTPAIQF